MSYEDVIELNQLALRYAKAVDTCDVGLFQGVFHSGGRLRSYHPNEDEPFVDLIGHEQLATIPNAMRGMFHLTTHMMINHLVEIDGDEASGEILCTARHLSVDAEDPTSLNVIIRYVDRYARLDGAWKIVDRQIRFLWSERHAVVDSGFARS